MLEGGPASFGNGALGEHRRHKMANQAMTGSWSSAKFEISQAERGLAVNEILVHTRGALAGVRT